MPAKHRIWVALNSETYRKFESKFPNTELNQWAKTLVSDIINERRIVIDFSDFRVKDLEILNMKLQIELLNEKLAKARGCPPPPRSNPPLATEEIEDG